MSGFAGAPVLIQIGIVGPDIGWKIFMLAVAVGLLATLLGAIGLYLTRGGAPGRDRAGTGLVLGLAIIGVVAVAGAGAFGLPAINDITTDMVDPPAFVAALELEGNRGRDMAYPATEFAPQQKAAYPDLAPLRLEATLAETTRRAEAAIGELGWEITNSDPSGGTLEVTKTSGIFRFVDDIAIRLRPDGTATIVDVRSKSRLGRGDLGANAGHIRAFQDLMVE
jgi:uncharacterized protein (DUF1499 family)